MGIVDVHNHLMWFPDHISEQTAGEALAAKLVKLERSGGLTNATHLDRHCYDSRRRCGSSSGRAGTGGDVLHTRTVLPRRRSGDAWVDGARLPGAAAVRVAAGRRLVRHSPNVERTETGSCVPDAGTGIRMLLSTRPTSSSAFSRLDFLTYTPT